MVLSEEPKVQATVRGHLFGTPTKATIQIIEDEADEEDVLVSVFYL